MYEKNIKRPIDLFVAVIGFLLALPIFIIAAIFIKIESKGPVFFLQTRVGKDLSNFTIYKFRTMTNHPRKIGKTPLIGKVEGVTSLGYILRKFKIDELPQLLNVIKGEMSLVGPRPNVPDNLPRLSKEQIKRYNVKPGLTGLSQVCGSIHLPWDERIDFDLEYIENVSFKTDMKIFKRTFLVVIKGEQYFVDNPLKIA